MEQDTVKTSVIIPTRNRPDLLVEAVASVGRQTYRDIELIVVDDGSTEPIEAQSRAEWAKHRDQASIRVVHQAPQNGNVARNAGVACSSGEFIQFLDSDDIIAPQKLELQVNQLVASPGLDFVYAYERFYRTVPGDLGVVWNCDWFESPYTALDRFLASEPVWQTGGPLWRRSAFDRGLKWNEELSSWQDWEFHTIALLKGFEGKRSPYELYFLREHAGVRTFNAENYYRRKRNEWIAGTAVLSALKNNPATPRSYYAHFECFLRKRLDELKGDWSAEASAYRQLFIGMICQTCASSKYRVLLKLAKQFAHLKFSNRLLAVYTRNVPIPLVHMSTWKQVELPILQKRYDGNGAPFRYPTNTFPSE